MNRVLLACILSLPGIVKPSESADKPAMLIQKLEATRIALHGVISTQNAMMLKLAKDNQELQRKAGADKWLLMVYKLRAKRAEESVEGQTQQKERGAVVVPEVNRKCAIARMLKKTVDEELRRGAAKVAGSAQEKSAYATELYAFVQKLQKIVDSYNK